MQKALTELKLARLLISNQKVLINTIPILDSYEIENIVTTKDKLFLFANVRLNQI